MGTYEIYYDREIENTEAVNDFFSQVSDAYQESYED